MTAELLFQFAGLVIGAAVTYGAIRADLRNLHEGVKRAHERIDDLVVRRR